MVVPKIAMRYFASSVAIIKQGDRQLKFVKIKNTITNISVLMILGYMS